MVRAWIARRRAPLRPARPSVTVEAISRRRPSVSTPQSGPWCRWCRESGRRHRGTPPDQAGHGGVVDHVQASIERGSGRLDSTSRRASRNDSGRWAWRIRARGRTRPPARSAAPSKDRRDPLRATDPPAVSSAQDAGRIDRDERHDPRAYGGSRARPANRPPACALYDYEIGGPSNLRIEQVDDPVPGPGEILVRIGHAAFNRRDVFVRRGSIRRSNCRHCSVRTGRASSRRTARARTGPRLGRAW